MSELDVVRRLLDFLSAKRCEQGLTPYERQRYVYLAYREQDLLRLADGEQP